MDGVNRIEYDGVLCYRVEKLSTDLKEEIRGSLAGICHGAEKATSGSSLYTYKRTLREFLNRFYKKTEATQKGMIGELLSHVLLTAFEKKYASINPCVNMEEESIKKGFDLVFSNSDDKNVWLAEVKAGACSANVDDKLKSLLRLARDDLFEKLNSSRFALWQNAINGVAVAVKDISVKKALSKILERHNENAVDGLSKSQDYNVILIAVAFKGDLIFTADDETVIREQSSQSIQKKFKSACMVAIQKSTLGAIVDFFEDEVTS